MKTLKYMGIQPSLNAYKEEFSYRLRNRTINENLEEYQKSLELLVSLYLEHAATVRSQNDFTLEELIEIIEKLARKKAPGLDGVTTELLKAAGQGVRFAPFFLKNLQIEMNHFFTMSNHETNLEKKFHEVWR